MGGASSLFNNGGSSGIFGSASSGLNTAGGVLGIGAGLAKGGVIGNTQAALTAGSLANKNGLLGSNAGGALGAAGGALGVYTGLQQGGVMGYGNAAAGALRAGSGIASLAGDSSLASGLGSAAGAIAIPLSIYNAVSGYKSGDTGGDAIRGAEAGAAIGSVVPVVGTAIGALVGGAVGAISSAFGSGKVDPENANFEGFTKAYSAAKTPQQQAQVAAATSNPYLPLAGLFDLRSNQIKGNIPIVSQYGRQGEQQFTTDMFNTINSAVSKGTISKSSSTADIMSQVVQPWINGFGKGQMTDSNSGAINAMVSGLVDDFRTGDTAALKPVGGQASPFANMKFGASPSTSTAASSAPVGLSAYQPTVGLQAYRANKA